MNFNIDLKNIDLKNISLEDIQAKLKKVEKKTWIKIGVSFGAVIFFLIIFYGVLNPIVNKKKAQLNDMNSKKEETEKFIKDIKIANKKIKKMRPKYEQYSTLFHTRAEVEGLYQTLSEFAAMNNLVISKIEKKDIKEVTKSDAIAKATGKKKKNKKSNKKKKKTVKNIAYYQIPVDFEITGNFLGYIKFKRQLSLSQKMLNFDKESIKVVKGSGDSTGAIKVNGTLTIVGLADDFF
ncbi:MAG: pilus assembly protein PilO [Candidatus Pelagibacter sp.]